MRISRREFLKYCTIAAGALGLTTTDLLKIEQAFGKADPGGSPFGAAPYVVWIPGQACTGCTMTLTNSVFYTDIGSLVLNDISLNYSETLAAASGEKIVDSAISSIGKPMVLVLEGSIPHGGTNGVNEEFCTVWNRTSGIVAAGSVIGGATQANGILTRKLGSTTLQAGDVIKAGSEIVGSPTATVIPAGSVVSAAADRAALGGTYAGSASLGSNTLNRAVTIGALATTGVITMYGGTDTAHPSGSTLKGGSIIDTGTVYHDSFDRADLELHASAGLPITWAWSATGGMTLSSGPVTMGAAFDRRLSGMVELAGGSTLAAGTILQTGTVVSASGDRSAIDPTLVAFGFTAAGDGNVLTATLNYTGADYVLTGDITLPAPPAIAAGSLGFDTVNKDKTMLNESVLFATSAAAVLCVGTCSAFGGIPAAKGNRTGASGALYKGHVKAGKYNGPEALVQFAGKTVNIPGCPPHPDWIVGTIAHLLATNFQIPDLEAYARPMAYFGTYQCNAGPCEWRYNQGYGDESAYCNPKSTPSANVEAINSSKLYKFKWAGDPSKGNKRYVGCLGAIGCKGRKTKADCSLRRWNGDNSLNSGLPYYGANWCVGSGAGCHGCTEPSFPDKVGKFFNFA